MSARTSLLALMCLTAGWSMATLAGGSITTSASSPADNNGSIRRSGLTGAGRLEPRAAPEPGRRGGYWTLGTRLQFELADVPAWRIR